MTGVQEDGRRKYRAFIRNDITPFFGERAPIDAVTQDTDAAWILYPKPHTHTTARTSRRPRGASPGCCRGS
ncbi:hypothetical protein IU486_10145 [Streptomyces gardneri]|uniref:hypothetical protein n=1 Tax=Nocardia TaxID=1817 RepID=UPI001357603B|nr:MULTISPECIES: hypothetical protein [Nocardia]MBF6165133.1 hypothetical protein [Streptomyces gardneri]